uniref:FLYWCH-type domain-containing protein n=1 Tax=Glossina brevipalpis TaxID=37001 RepID=A0A1A9WMN8_9MUSC
MKDEDDLSEHLFLKYILFNYPSENHIFSSIQYVKGQRGSRKMVCGGHSYICANIKKNRKYWVCAKQRSKNCKARLITDMNEVEFISRNITHNHASDVNLIKQLKDLKEDVNAHKDLEENITYEVSLDDVYYTRPLKLQFGIKSLETPNLII